ncbi:hypothetical protein TNCV_1608561 [Trichonephila clavipes]|nr:hypothetical protein TNCV_1608561 [Trichonephila clavipes]
MVDQKTSDDCKGHLALAVRDEKQLMCIARSQRTQTFTQITTQLNDAVSRTINKLTVQCSFHSMSFGSRRPTKVPSFSARYRITRLAWAR